jgi:hypothetical protein
MNRIVLAPLALCGFAACYQPKNTPPPKPTSTTAFLFDSNFSSGELQAIDVASREAGRVLGPEAISSDSLVRAYGETLYIIGREFNGDNNSVTVLEPKNNYQRACPNCQWPLGTAVNVQDFWAVSKTKAYLTTQPGSKTAPAYEHRNDVWIMNPTTGEVSGYIDIAAALRAAGDNLADVDTDGMHELGAVYADDAHLFVAISAFDETTFQQVKADTPCGYEPGRVAVIDLSTDKVTKILKLSGSNPAPSPARFVPEPNTDNVLISTPGPLGAASIESCGGIERIDQAKLTVSGFFTTETQLGGSVVSFGLDGKGNGVVFLFTDGDFNSPTYEVRRFNKSGIVGDAILAPGAKGFSQPSFVTINDRGQAYVGLPLRTGTEIGMYDADTGTTLGDPLKTDLPPIDVAFFPGTPYSR